MATELTHRIVIEGPAAQVRKFKEDVARPRVPFSFEALWRMGRFPGDPPLDPYNLTGFPIRQLRGRRAEIRYTFLTRNMGVDDLLARVSRRRPLLIFRLATLADDGNAEVFLIRQGRRRRRDVPDWLNDYHRHRVALEHGISREAMEDDFHFGWEADWAIVNDAVNLWNDVVPRQMPPRPETWGGRRVRLLEDEWEMQLHEFVRQVDWEAAGE